VDDSRLDPDQDLACSGVQTLNSRHTVKLLRPPCRFYPSKSGAAAFAATSTVTAECRYVRVAAKSCLSRSHNCITADVRVRILKPMAGVLDGVSLGHLIPGLTYEVEESLGSYLVSTQSAEEVAFDDSRVVDSKDEALLEHVARGVTITSTQPLERVVSHDRPRKSRRKRR
jgi:hypothetical protein